MVKTILQLLMIFPITLALPFESLATGVRVYLIAGQSNAAGMAHSYYLTDAEAAIPENVELWVNVSGVAGDHRMLSSHRDLPKFGPEVKLIKLLANHYPTERIVVIKVAKNGTNMANWVWGGSMHTLFFDTISTILQGESPRFQALFWMQGEADCKSDERADTYEARVISFFVDVRALDYNMTICMGLVNPPTSDYPEVYKVVNAQLRVGNSDPYTRLVTTQGLTKLMDGLHYDKQGQLELGWRMYQTAMGN